MAAEIQLDAPRLTDSALTWTSSVLDARDSIARSDRPLVTLSWAQSIDGSITAQRGTQTSISNGTSFRLSHLLRARHEAILAGVETILSDNPRLSTRLVEGPSPRVAVLDSRLRTPPSSRIFQDEPTVLRERPLVFTAGDITTSRDRDAVEAVAEIVTVPRAEAGGISLPGVLSALADRGIRSLMVEGGARVIASFLDAGLFDTCAITVAPALMDGYRIPVPAGSFPLAGNGWATPRWFDVDGDAWMLAHREWGQN